MLQPMEKTVEVTELLTKSFIEYSGAVNFGRSFLDARDGLKPVQRCILYALKNLGLIDASKTGKVQKVASLVSGNWHPHGDAAAAAALFKLGQWWVMRYPLVYSDGNFGSPDENPASPRYPDTSLSAVGRYMIGNDLNPNIVSFRPNYDETDSLPTILPGLFPNLLCNGQKGIGSAMAFESVPHNLREVAAAIKTVARKPNTTIRKLLSLMPGPDFPTGGVLYRETPGGEDCVRQYYETGSSTLVLRGKIHKIGNHKSGPVLLIISELPYGVGRDQFIEDLRKHIDDFDEIIGITNLSGEETRIEIELKNGSNAEKVIERLFSMTKLQISISVNNTFVDMTDDGPTIRCMSLRDMIDIYIEHRINVIVKRSELRLDVCEKRIVILDGFRKAIRSIKRVIDIVRKSKNKAAAKAALSSEIGLSEIQAEAVLDMTISRLTAMASNEIDKELSDLENETAKLKTLLSSRDEQIKLMCNEIDEMVSKIGDERRTAIIEGSVQDATADDLEADDSVLVVSDVRTAKQCAIYEMQIDPESGEPLLGTKDAKKTLLAKTIKPTERVSIVDDAGQIYIFDVAEIPFFGTGELGVDLKKICGIDGLREVVMLDTFDPNETSGKFVLSVTSGGYVKQTDLSKFSSRRPSGMRLVAPAEDEKVVFAAITTNGDQVVIASRNNKACRFDLSSIRSSGTNARGTRGMKLKSNDMVVGAATFSPESGELVFCSVDRRLRRSPIESVPLRSKGVQGTSVFTPKDTMIADVVYLAKNRNIRYVSNLKEAGLIRSNEIPESKDPNSGQNKPSSDIRADINIDRLMTIMTR